MTTWRVRMVIEPLPLFEQHLAAGRFLGILFSPQLFYQPLQNILGEGSMRGGISSQGLEDKDPSFSIKKQFHFLY